MKFKVEINTERFKPCDNNQVNAIVFCMNGWTSIEHSYKEVLWRFKTLVGYGLSEEEHKEDGERYYKWLNKKTNYIFVGRKQIYEVRLPGLAQGYTDCQKLVEELRKNGSVSLELSNCYDPRQNLAKLFKGCYITITKI